MASRAITRGQQSKRYRSSLSVLATAARGLGLALGVLITLTTLSFARLLVVSGEWCHDHFSATARRAVGRRPAAFIAPLLPLYTLSWTLLGDAHGWSGVGATAGWLLVGFALIEVHSASLRRESYIAAFEPEWVPTRRRTLGGPTQRNADRRLAHTLQTHVAYALPIWIVALCQPIELSGASVLIVLFALRYFGYSNGDFEACVHWNMHCDVFSSADPSRLSRMWEPLMDYVVGPLNGYVPRVYNANHLLVHHWRNSGPDDIHSATPYRRTSLLEFSFFALKLTASIMFATDLAFHRRCTGRKRIRLLANVTGFWLAVGLMCWLGSLAGPLLILFAVHHGVTMARSQYVWHGLIPPERPDLLTTSTVLWVSDAEFWARSLASPSGPTSSDTREIESEAVPRPGTNWAFFDNLHLLHHMRPRAHFTDYPVLLSKLVPRMVADQSVVMCLDGYDTFAYDCWSMNIERIASYLKTDTAEQSPVAFILERLQPAHGYRHPIGQLCERPTMQALDRRLTRALGTLTGGR